MFEEVFVLRDLYSEVFIRGEKGGKTKGAAWGGVEWVGVACRDVGRVKLGLAFEGSKVIAFNFFRQDQTFYYYYFLFYYYYFYFYLRRY